jgi:hypothetical protein
MEYQLAQVMAWPEGQRGEFTRHVVGDQDDDEQPEAPFAVLFLARVVWR